MALKIEEQYGRAKLRNIVKEGHVMFFRTYGKIRDPLSVSN
jgi:hypothetical protein